MCSDSLGSVNTAFNIKGENLEIWKEVMIPSGPYEHDLSTC